MNPGRFVAGLLLSLTGLGLFFIETGFGFAGPQLPTTPLGFVAWLLVLGGLALAKLGVPR
jgi:hypothetical protein